MQGASNKKSDMKRIFDGLVNRDPKIRLSETDSERINYMFSTVLHQNPMIIYVNGYSCSFNPFGITIYPMYCMDLDRTHALIKACMKTLERLIRVIDTGDPYTTICRLHRELTTKVTYKEGENAHSIVGPLLEKKCVCEGFSKVTQVVCNMLKIPCRFATGKVKGGSGYHSWNQIEINGKWYNVDMTFDICFEGHEIFDYFLVTDKQICRDHEFIGRSMGCTSRDLDHFTVNGLNMASPEDLRQFLSSSNMHPGDFVQFRVLWDENSDDELSDSVRRMIRRAFPQFSYSTSFNNMSRAFMLYVIE